MLTSSQLCQLYKLRRGYIAIFREYDMYEFGIPLSTSWLLLSKQLYPHLISTGWFLEQFRECLNTQAYELVLDQVVYNYWSSNTSRSWYKSWQVLTSLFIFATRRSQTHVVHTYTHTYSYVSYTIYFLHNTFYNGKHREVTLYVLFVFSWEDFLPW